MGHPESPWPMAHRVMDDWTQGLTMCSHMARHWPSLPKDKAKELGEQDTELIMLGPSSENSEIPCQKPVDHENFMINRGYLTGMA